MPYIPALLTSSFYLSMAIVLWWYLLGRRFVLKVQSMKETFSDLAQASPDLIFAQPDDDLLRRDKQQSLEAVDKMKRYNYSISHFLLNVLCKRWSFQQIWLSRELFNKPPMYGKTFARRPDSKFSAYRSQRGV